MEMSQRYPMSSFPNGWYAVCSRSEIEKGKVIPIQALGRELVAFQTESGAISVLDAHCPHQGAHLGHGGTIKGETIECPFHKWCFDTAGKCQKIPYCDSIPKTKKAEIHAYPILERLGKILIYFSSDYSAPSWEIPQFENDLIGNWTEPTFSEMSFTTHIQEFAENGFDLAHFKPVHRSEENSIELNKKQAYGPLLAFALNLIYPGSGMGKFGGKVGVHVDWRYHGLSVFETFVTLRDYPMQLRQYFFFTPLDTEKVRVEVALRVNKDKIKLPNPLRYLVLKLIEKQYRKILLQNFEEDRAIWENKIFRGHPLLVDGDGPIGHLRAWMKQFYPPSTAVQNAFGPKLETEEIYSSEKSETQNKAPLLSPDA
jgi:phenylpropionate dioxygenase-like ring-hydroxylating dioxygenase large terminal subunit